MSRMEKRDRNSRKADNRKTDSRKTDGGGKTNRVRAHFWYMANIVLLCSVTLLALAGSVLFFLQTRNAVKEKNELADRLEAVEGDRKTLYTEDEVREKVEQAKSGAGEAERRKILMQIQSDMESGGSTASMLRGLFSNDLVVVSGGKYYFYPILHSVSKNAFQSADFSLSDDGRLQYTGKDKVTLQSGVEVSEKNGDIDWNLVSEDDIAFAMVCAGGRLTSDVDGKEAGSIVADEKLKDNVSGAYEAGLNAGVYYVLGAASEEEAEEEAERLIQHLEPVHSMLTYPVAVWVNVPAETDRTAGQSRADWTGYVLSFCESLEEAGYQPMIYGNLASFVMMLNLEDLEKYSKWISNPGAGLYFPYQFSMWQYSTSGTVHGISTEVGLDVSLSVG